MTLISAILFSFAANLDNIAIGISYGIKKTNIAFLNNLLISVVTTFITYVSMLLGKSIILFFNFESFANLLGATLLIAIGSINLIQDILKKSFKKDSIISEITFKETLSILFILSSNNVAAGIASSVAGINIFYTTFLTFILGFLFLYIGNTLGKSILNKYIVKYCCFISSLFLIVLGFFEILYK
ncbi:MAG: manganese efflux pump [Clostridia bacterium]